VAQLSTLGGIGASRDISRQTNMKTVIAFACFAVATLALAADKVSTETSPISISVAIPARNGERRVEYRDRGTHFHVIVSNTSDKPKRIWREGCSWGYFGLTFEFGRIAAGWGHVHSGWRQFGPQIVG
jgi:hypothetical protein